ncbi:hypothetical protein ABIA22_002736 [Sinorhizobium fredii]
MRASRSSPVAGNSRVDRSEPDSTNRTFGKAIAMRRTTSEMAAASAFSDFMNLSRAGVAKKRSRTSTTVPTLAGEGRTGSVLPPATEIAAPSLAPAVRVVIDRRATDPIEGSASPRKPSVRMSVSASSILEVQCRRMASSRSAGDMPLPLSAIRSSVLPPPAVATSILVAPASRAFSISSLAALAGRSMTSPAAIWLMSVSESCLMAMVHLPGFGEGGEGASARPQSVGGAARRSSCGRSANLGSRFNSALTFCCDFPQQPE